MTKRWTTLEAVFLVLMAACGVALKPIVGPLTKLIGSALFIPSGALAGAIYMMWPMLALLVVRRFGAATFVGILEGIIVLVTGFYGSHGFLSLVTYIGPCVVMDLSFLPIQQSRFKWCRFFPPAWANVTGVLLVGILIMRIPTLPLMLGCIPAFILGGMGGLLAFWLYRHLIKVFPQFGKAEDQWQEARDGGQSEKG